MSTPPSPRETGTFYVAPTEAPTPRKPPALEVGLLHWMRENLFKTPVDTVITLITLLVIGWALWGFFGWAFLEAQWEIVFQNLRSLNVGQQFPIDAVWRAEIIALIIVFLGMLTVGVFGRVLRGYLIAIGVIIALMILVPIVTQSVPEPPVYTFVDSTYKIRQVSFIAQEGQEMTFTLQPLTEFDEYRLENIKGFVENDNQQANTAFDMFTAASTEVVPITTA